MKMPLISQMRYSQTDYSYEGENAIQTGAFIEISGEGDDVTLKNLTVDTNSKAKHGIQFYCVEGGKLDNVTVNGGSYTSVIVNGSKVKITSSVMNPDDGAYANIEYVYPFLCFAGDQHGVWLWNKAALTGMGLLSWTGCWLCGKRT